MKKKPAAFLLQAKLNRSGSRESDWFRWFFPFHSLPSNLYLVLIMWLWFVCCFNPVYGRPWHNYATPGLGRWISDSMPQDASVLRFSVLDPCVYYVFVLLEPLDQRSNCPCFSVFNLLFFIIVWMWWAFFVITFGPLDASSSPDLIQLSLFYFFIYFSTFFHYSLHHFWPFQVSFIHKNLFLSF